MSEKRELKAANLNRSERIIEFLRGHDLINRNLLCSRADYDAANLYNIMNGSAKYVAIPPKYLDSFEEQLKGYGFGN